MNKNKCIIISLMSGSPWGGSEELWYRVAKCALEENRDVIISIKKWNSRNVKIDYLEKSGAKIIQRVEAPKKFLNILFKKVLNKFFGKLKSKTWNWIDPKFKGTVLLNLGGPDDFLAHNDLIEYLNFNRINYSVIQQFNFENIIYNEYDRRIVKLFYSNAKNAYFVSKRNLDTTERSICKKLENARIISNPANLSEIELIPFPQQMDQINFACVARLDCMFKAQDILLSVLGNDKWLKRDWKLNFYGEGKDLEYLKELVNFYKLNSRVYFHGHVNNVESIWKNNHILILPSLAEGTPLALIEAMVCGRPSIVSDVGGNTELIEDGISGFIVSNSSVKQLDLALENAWQQKGSWGQMGFEARKAVLEKIDFESYKLIYNNAIKN